MAGRMMAENGLGTWRGMDAEELGADGDSAVGADFEDSALTPDKGPPRALGDRAQNGAFLLESEVPSLLGLHFELTVSFVLVTMETQLVDVGIGLVEVGDLFTGKVSRETILPEEVRSLDFALGLRGRSVAKGDAVEVKGATQLSESLWGMGEEEGMEIHVDLQRQTVFDEGGREQIKVGEQVFGLVNSGSGEDTTAIIEHVDHGKGLEAVWKPGMRRGVQLPELAEVAALPAADRGCGAVIRFGMSEVMLDGPAADLSSVHAEVALTEHLAASEAVGGRGFTAEHFAQERVNLGRPVRRMIASGGARGPGGLLMMGTRLKVVAVELIEPGAPQAQLFSGSGGLDAFVAEETQHMTDKWRSTAL
jgi:hypothetical protein